ncbi:MULTISPECIES: DNA polymerase III subunit delta' [Pseudoalteromonas]|uniref:DNA-directed DNA polymerase n=1 Tax=Pseudoalteromonas obscura TaxID=3048491 RepID=A0ABT7EF04_9GAMM|nr:MULTISPECIES: DNA polymerase III subunit delta' [Pseudoalteromonas]MBQ4835898.1 DNA polymerase III subunit delta' [Pseudoalteromonas luteoviolacea]MDK2593857.1 DNA polymerase III subunit delta' [Pseudoalteromonas sp. P94(2023)]
MYPWLEPVQHRMQENFARSRFHHAQLLHGLEGVGKRELSRVLSEGLLCVNSTETLSSCGGCKSCMLIKAQNHPDLLYLSADSSSIGVDEIRTLNEFVFHSAQQGGNKVVVIEQIEKMTESAANALLKTLEEPAAKRYILMTCNDVSKVKATVLSRCNQVQVAITDKRVSQHWLAEQGISSSAYPWVDIFSEQPLLLSKWAQQEVISEVDYLWKVSHDIASISDINALETALAKDAYLLSVFARFLMQVIKQQLTVQHIGFVQFHNCTVQIEKYMSDHHRILGINKTLSLSNLVFGLQRVLKQD